MGEQGIQVRKFDSPMHLLVNDLVREWEDSEQVRNLADVVADGVMAWAEREAKDLSSYLYLNDAPNSWVNLRSFGFDVVRADDS